MRLRTKYILFVVIIHAITLVLSYAIFKQHKLLFIVSEIFILFSIFISIQLYKQLLQPLQTIMQGLEAIKDREFNVRFVTTGKYEMDKLISVYNEMMEQLKLERTKQEEQHFFLSKLISTSPTGIVVLNHDGLVQQLNPKALDLLGINEREVIGKLPEEISHPVMHEISKLESGKSKTITVNGITTYKLQKSHFIDRGFPRYFVMLEELTQEILEAEKKAYGKVIRMMAHEVNNTIGPVNSIIESTLNTPYFTGNEESGSYREALSVALERNRNLNVFMRNFAEVVRLPQPVKKTIDLHKLINEVAVLMKTKAAENNVSFEYKFAAENIFISADEQQMAQALINIVKNAVESIVSDGKVTFTTVAHPARLIITDTGKGINAEQNEEIFRPFFSTKRTGQGIGLTLVKEILLNHHFSFSLKTIQPGQTEFEIMFST